MFKSRASVADSGPVLNQYCVFGTNVGLIMYMSGDSPFFAWMKTGEWTGFQLHQLVCTFHIKNKFIQWTVELF